MHLSACHHQPTSCSHFLLAKSLNTTLSLESISFRRNPLPSLLRKPAYNILLRSVVSSLNRNVFCFLPPKAKKPNDLPCVNCHQFTYHPSISIHMFNYTFIFIPAPFIVFLDCRHKASYSTPPGFSDSLEIFTIDTCCFMY